MRQYSIALATRLAQGGIAYETSYLVGTYGKQSSLIVDYFEAHRTGQPEMDLLLAEIWFCVHYEMVVSISDFVVRRTGMLYFNMPKLLRNQSFLLQEFSRQMNWSKEQIQIEAATLQQLIVNCTHFT